MWKMRTALWLYREQLGKPIPRDRLLLPLINAEWNATKGSVDTASKTANAKTSTSSGVDPTARIVERDLALFWTSCIRVSKAWGLHERFSNQSNRKWPNVRSIVKQWSTEGAKSELEYNMLLYRAYQPFKYGGKPVTLQPEPLHVPGKAVVSAAEKSKISDEFNPLDAEHVRLASAALEVVATQKKRRAEAFACGILRGVRMTQVPGVIVHRCEVVKNNKRGRCILCCEDCEKQCKGEGVGHASKGQGMKTPYKCTFCKVFLCTEKRACCGSRTCFDVHHCDFSYPLLHPMIPSVVSAQASPLVSIVASFIEQADDEDEEDDETA